MPYVVTQPCCADASCVAACPVNCIHPAPGEPGFGQAEMLFIDAKTCVGCGACVTACPVGAIVPENALDPSQFAFKDLAAEYYADQPHDDRWPLAIIESQRRIARPGPFRVAVVGAGPAGLYTADELLAHPEVEQVDVIERLDVPHGLARHGVAADHGSTRQVTRLFESIESEPRFQYVLGVDVGTDVTLAQLRSRYDAVVYAVGASSDRSLDIEGEELRGSLGAAEVVGWANSHPERAGLDVPLDHERAVVIGNGNVALDVARLLTRDTETVLAATDINRDALAQLRASSVREVVVLGRRGPNEAAFSTPELIGLAGLEDVDVVVEADPADIDTSTAGGRVLAELAGRPVPSTDSGRRRIVLRFQTSPVELLGDDRVTGVRVVHNDLVPDEDGVVHAMATELETVIDAGLVVRAIGHRALAVDGLPQDPRTGVVENERGRVEPGVYVTGWVKRGPSGFIGTNKSCAQETVASLLDDLDAGLPVPTEPALASVGAAATATPTRTRRPRIAQLTTLGRTR
ncbi:ferredoxin--NADP+ reductase [Knoellia remsis]|uniref:ferredoxin--NADP(+) reductase n=1 Tax=Knoellia remsis TaxID=407159 RepID=A0A2T0UY57_9MICO|nr:FAD-dependent oxidoreductase [Knoellia remsis]PRY62856.1 ferredoxin--NADP+ reductase [Knoellia remsis]